MVQYRPVVLLSFLLWVGSVRADCVAQVSASLEDANNQLLTYTYYGASGQNASCPGTEIYSSWNGGASWSFAIPAAIDFRARAAAVLPRCSVIGAVEQLVV